MSKHREALETFTDSVLVDCRRILFFPQISVDEPAAPRKRGLGRFRRQPHFGSDYPTLLSKKIGRPILNKGVPGETSENALSRLEEIVRLQPRVVLLCLGGNDALQQLPLDKTFANISTIIDRLQQNGSFVVLIGIRSASISDRYSSPFKKLAKEKHVLFVPNILSGILGTPHLMSDYVHPNEEGYNAIAERLEKILTPLLPQL